MSRWCSPEGIGPSCFFSEGTAWSRPPLANGPFRGSATETSFHGATTPAERFTHVSAVGIFSAATKRILSRKMSLELLMDRPHVNTKIIIGRIRSIAVETRFLGTSTR